jgi:putative addiction module component (TIGR02574 family)
MISYYSRSRPHKCFMPQVRLLQDLWGEIAEEYAASPLRESHRRLLDERLRQHQEHPDDVEPWENARDDVLGEVSLTGFWSDAREARPPSQQHYGIIR